jgi:hypothetical protein
MTLREDALQASYRRLERPLYNVLYRRRRRTART